MSLTPENTPEPSAQGMPEEAVSGGESSAGPRRWNNRLVGFVFAILALEIGLFLLIFPWMDIWNLNYFQGSIPALQDIWDDPLFRGAVTGVGLLNIFIACLEGVHLIRRS